MTLQRQIVEEISIQEKNGYFCKRERRMHNIIREKTLPSGESVQR
jgi:hypothetical protein